MILIIIVIIITIIIINISIYYYYIYTCTWLYINIIILCTRPLLKAANPPGTGGKCNLSIWQGIHLGRVFFKHLPTSSGWGKPTTVYLLVFERRLGWTWEMPEYSRLFLQKNDNNIMESVTGLTTKLCSSCLVSPWSAGLLVARSLFGQHMRNRHFRLSNWVPTKNTTKIGHVCIYIYIIISVCGCWLTER